MGGESEVAGGDAASSGIPIRVPPLTSSDSVLRQRGAAPSIALDTFESQGGASSSMAGAIPARSGGSAARESREAKNFAG